MMEEEIRRQFQQYLGNDALLAVSPGRVNLIGEHTDYNLGFVLPAAIDRKIDLGISSNDDNRLNLRALEYGEQFSFSLDDMKPVKGWATYLLGMIYMVMPEKRLPYGMNVILSGDIPVGAGMSSSAALCSAFGVALNERFGLGLSKLQIALAGQQTEHRFAEVQCGIMDQFACMYGKAGHLIKLDCRTLEFEYIPFDYPDVQIVLVNTMVSHTLASSEYNLRRQQCEAGVALLQKYDPAIRSLRDVQPSQLEKYRNEMDPVVYRRCLFIVEENQRLLDACDRLQNHQLNEFGQLMYAAHEGLRKDYEVSCPESDFLVHAVQGQPGVKGARQMGGGFGGCIITLVEKEYAGAFVTDIRKKYEMKFGKLPDCYTMQIRDGAHIMPMPNA